MIDASTRLKPLYDVTPLIFFDHDDYWRKDPDYGNCAAIVPSIRLDVAIPTILELGLRSGKIPADDVKKCLEAKLQFTTDWGHRHTKKTHESVATKSELRASRSTTEDEHPKDESTVGKCLRGGLIRVLVLFEIGQSNLADQA